jgi:hypothetical protein
MIHKTSLLCIVLEREQVPRAIARIPKISKILPHLHENYGEKASRHSLSTDSIHRKALHHVLVTICLWCQNQGVYACGWTSPLIPAVGHRPGPVWFPSSCLLIVPAV